MPWRIYAEQWCVRPKELIGNAITHFRVCIKNTYTHTYGIYIWGMYRYENERKNLNVRASFNGVFWSRSISSEANTKHHHRWNFNPIICQFCFYTLYVCVCVRYGCSRLFPYLFFSTQKFPGKQKRLANFAKNLCKYVIAAIDVL